jgi:hypothetical protein
MADLQSPWTSPPVPTKDLGGDSILKRGGDPNADGGDGPNGLKPMWSDPPDSTLTEKAETPNSVSGLPTTPSRWEPSGTPPPPPSLQDRSPGTIDEQ